MASLFRRQKSDEVLHDEDLLLASRDISSLVPASARSFDNARFSPLQLPDELEDDDQDLEFLSSVASAAEKDAPAPKRPEPRREAAPAAPVVETVTLPSEQDDLAAFRNVGDEDERLPLSRIVKLPDVEIGDLLEDLDTTIAALRRKRAA